MERKREWLSGGRDNRGRDRKGFVSRVSESADADYADKLKRNSRQPTNGAYTLLWIGVGLIVLGIVVSAAGGTPVGIAGLSSLGVFMIILSAVVRPLDRILAQLIQINEKLGRSDHSGDV